MDQVGCHQLSLWLSIGAFADEIQSGILADAEDWKAECARDRAIERWMDARANGPYHYTGTPVNA